MKLTIFDLDNTLIAGDSDYAWGQFLVEKGIVDREQYTQENNRFYEDYKRACLDIHEYQRFVMSPLLAMSKDLRNSLRQEFLREVIDPLRLPLADTLIQRHQQQGDELMIITATNRFIAGPIASLLGIDNILATEPEEVDGRFTGSIRGIPCFQEGKVARLQEWLELQGRQPSKLTFYSDSINDLPLLKYADEAIAVDPDEALEAHAQQQGWSVISLRD